MKFARRFPGAFCSLVLAFAVGLAGCGGGGSGGGGTLPSLPGTSPGTNPGTNPPGSPSGPTPVNPSPVPGPVIPAPGPNPAPAPVPRGVARFTVRWTEAGTPAASQSVKITLTLNNQTLGEEVLPRPAAAFNSSDIRFTELSPADIIVRAAAYPNADGTGIAQATGSFVVTVKPGETTEQALDLTSTVRQIKVEPGVVSVGRGAPVPLLAAALDADGSVVLTAHANWSWTSDNPAIVAVRANGPEATLTAGADGAATVTVRESQSGATASARANVVPYRATFANGAGPEWSSGTVGTTPVGARPFLGPFGKESVRLALNDLPPHASITITFDLFVIQSWDGNNTTPNLGPDRWSLRVDGGPTLLDTSFNNHTQSSYADPNIIGLQSYPDSFGQGSNPPQTGAAEKSALGYSWLDASADAVYQLRYTFPHGANSVAFEFGGTTNQDINDESWGLSNVAVSVTP